MRFATSAEVPTLGGEQVLVAGHDREAIRLAVTDPYFGRIATIRLDPLQASELAQALAAQAEARA